ncbi:MAG: carbamate kinase [Pseudomonadota bacterium]|nr:carbamate kinase [Gammaproteobacteria bacterium]MBU1558278.1 carbamate kinase [Gammaproteobacteria bacterium]MBU1926173.1 carbamate kinase [Gammaproteobacteria bacterium]MBU2546570.1 carbamate kinase [Gammaproteobacteria bacterium]
MLIVIALGGNALLQRGEPLEAETQRKNVREASKEIAKLAKQHQVVICHGNGPQVGLLALQAEAYTQVKPYPLDVLDAETQGMIGYLIQQEVDNAVGNQSVVTLLTQIIVDPNDPAFKNPSKPIGPVYSKEQAEKIAKERGWNVKEDGKYYRRVVPSPKPINIVELVTIKALIKTGHIVICGGGGGIPVMKTEDHKLQGIEAVIDKDHTASLIAEKLEAESLMILTDVKAVCENFGTPEEKQIKIASPEVLRKLDFPAGSMGPKILATCRFVEQTKHSAVIGRLTDIEDIMQGKAGTFIQANADGITYY